MRKKKCMRDFRSTCLSYTLVQKEEDHSIYVLAVCHAQNRSSLLIIVICMVESLVVSSRVP
jgi:hypothetical protein